jgi:hypothetical protein
MILSSLCDCVTVYCSMHSEVNPIYFPFSVVQLVAGVTQFLKWLATNWVAAVWFAAGEGFSLPCRVQTVALFHPDSYPLGADALFLGIIRTEHSALSPLSPYVFIAWCLVAYGQLESSITELFFCLPSEYRCTLYQHIDLSWLRMVCNCGLFQRNLVLKFSNQQYLVYDWYSTVLLVIS